MKEQNEKQTIEEMLSVFLQMVENVCNYEERLSYQVIEEGVKRQMAMRRAVIDYCDCEPRFYKCQSKQSEGEWILTGTFKSTFPLPVADFHEACSVCRWIPPKYSSDYKKYNFCPNCGAKMKGGAE